MKPTVCIAAVVLLATPVARAQEPPQSPQSAPEAQQAPRPAQGTREAGSALTREQIDHIFHVRQMEQVLTNAVKAGATSLAAQLQIGQPASLFATTDARTRGFDIEGYGVFFDVDVPAMLQSVVWSRQTLIDLEMLRQGIRASTNEEAKRMAAREIRRTERMLGIPPQPIPGIDDVGSQPPQGIAVATTTDVAAAAPSPAAAPPPVPTLPRDPRSADELYTEAIKNKIIDQILTFGGGLGVDDDQWLTVAARTTTAAPGQIDDSSSLFIRIKGSDLTAYVQKKITREEVVKRIQIKEG